MRKPLVTVLGLLALGSLSLAAAPVVAPHAVASLYARNASGSLVFFCSGALIQSDVISAAPIFMSAGHCADFLVDPEDPTGMLLHTFVTFDDGRSFTRVKATLIGHARRGHDVSFWETHEDEFPAVAPYKLAEEAVKVGDDLESWGNPAGIGLTFTRGYVRQAEIVRTWKGKSISWEGYIGADMNTAGGASGSSVFNAQGEVVGVLAGTFADSRGFQITAVYPVARLLAALQ